MAPLAAWLLAGCLALVVLHDDVAVAVASPTISTSSDAADAAAEPPSQRKLRGRFLHITDIHPDELYRPYTSHEEDVSCHRGEGGAGFYGAEMTFCDSPPSLVNATFDWIKAHFRDEFDFVVWTGDSARHDNDPEANPRSPREVRRTNSWIADKFVEAFSDEKKELTIPIVPNIGNNDFLPHNIFYPGPNEWLDFYAQAWRRFIPEYQRHSFQFGGWFYVEVIPNHLAVFSLNTMYFFDRNAAVDDCTEPWEQGYKHMEWLRVQLQQVRQRNMKAILIGHVPPARTEGKQLWMESCWQKYTLWLKQYSDVVAASIYGHMNIDHFMLQDTDDLVIPLLQEKQQQQEVDDDGNGRRHRRRRHGFSAPEGLDDFVAMKPKEDYLRELRSEWSKLPKAFDGKEAEHETGLFEGVGGKWARRYQLSLVGSSIVPNYFPSFRIYEYNITGLENVPLWKDEYFERHLYPSEVADAEVEAEAEAGAEAGVYAEAEVEVEAEAAMTETAANGGEDENSGDDGDGDEWRQELRRDLEPHKKRKRKKTHHPKPNDPYLVVPEGPSKSAPPGPAYSVQPLSLLGYTHYLANLTRINNLTQDPVPEPAAPLPFEFEVEYSTFDDKKFDLKDLTVLSYVKLAYRIGQPGNKHHHALVQDGGGNEVDQIEVEEEEEEEEEEEDLMGDETGAENNSKHKGKKHKKKKKKKHGGHHKSNKVWLEFLRRAFVSTVSWEELEAREEEVTAY